MWNCGRDIIGSATIIVPICYPANLLSCPSLISQILGYHIVSAAVLPASTAVHAITSTPARIVTLPTLDGQDYTLSFTIVPSHFLEALFKGSKDDIIVIAKGSTAKVVKTDIKAGASIIHVIDNVLLPIALP